MHVVNMGLSRAGLAIKNDAAFRQVIGRDGLITLYKYEMPTNEVYFECVQQRIIFRESVAVYLCLCDHEGAPNASTMWPPHDIEKTLSVSPEWWRDNVSIQPTELNSTLKEFEDKVRALRAQPLLPNELIQLRVRLIKEEYNEVIAALKQLSECPEEGVKAARENLLKELADLLYVVAGTAENLHLDLDTAFMRVHASNMTKDFGTTDAGKILKGKKYVAPNLKDLV